MSYPAVSESRADPAPVDTDVAARIERSFRILGRRVYGVGSARAGISAVDRVDVFLLGALENADMRPSDLAAAVELEMSTVSRRLTRLESVQLIRRRSDPQDGRVQRLSLTGDGQQVLDRARAARTAVLDAAFSEWSFEDRIQLLHLLDRLSADLDRSTVADNPPPAATNSSRKSNA